MRPSFGGPCAYPRGLVVSYWEGTGLLAVEAAWAYPGKEGQVAGTLQIDLVVAAALEVAEAAIARFCTEAAVEAASIVVVGAVASAFAEAVGVRVGPRGPLMKSPPVEAEGLAEPHWLRLVAVAFSAAKIKSIKLGFASKIFITCCCFC